MTNALKSIDSAFGQYFRRFSRSSFNEQGRDYGLFFSYIQEEELDDPLLPIENELGDTSNPYDCAYSWYINHKEFPLPEWCSIPDAEKEAFAFYIFQYCHVWHVPPTNNYIAQVIVPACHGRLLRHLLPDESYVILLLLLLSFFFDY